MAKNNSMKTLSYTCGGLTLIGGLCLVGLAIFIYRNANEFKESLKNPAENVERILGAQTLPEGYYPNLAFSIPFISDTIILSDKPNEGAEPPHMDRSGKGFIYNKIKLLNEKDREGLNAYFSGASDDPEILRRNKINLDFKAEDVLARGILELPGVNVRYLAAREVKSEDINAGMVNLMLFDCNADQGLRFAIWYTQEQPIEQEDKSFDLKGTVADEAVMREFLAHFNFCLKTAAN